VWSPMCLPRTREGRARAPRRAAHRASHEATRGGKICGRGGGLAPPRGAAACALERVRVELDVKRLQRARRALACGVEPAAHPEGSPPVPEARLSRAGGARVARGGEGAYGPSRNL
jgi:hypothetical protein